MQEAYSGQAEQNVAKSVGTTLNRLSVSVMEPSLSVALTFNHQPLTAGPAIPHSWGYQDVPLVVVLYGSRVMPSRPSATSYVAAWSGRAGAHWNAQARVNGWGMVEPFAG